LSEYTREEILRLIEENGGPEGLDLSGKDLSGIDLSREAIEAELAKVREMAPDETPVWYSESGWAANLQGADLQEANLVGAKLEGVDLKGANLREANLANADLQWANLELANAQGAWLRGANLQGAVLWDAVLQGAQVGFADLRKAVLWRTNFQGAEMWDANLQGAYLQEADLGGAKLKDADFQGAEMVYSHLEKVDFFEARSLAAAYFYNAYLDDTRMRSEQLGGLIGEEHERRYDEAKEAYLALKNNFAEIGRYGDAAWAYRKERQMEKLVALEEAKEAWQKRDWNRAVPRYAKVAGDQLVEWVCDYGEGIWRVAGSLIAMWVAFALIYGLIAGVWGPWQDTGSREIRYITRNPIDLLSFSLGAMTTIEPSGLEARPILVHCGVNPSVVSRY